MIAWLIDQSIHQPCPLLNLVTAGIGGWIDGYTSRMYKGEESAVMHMCIVYVSHPCTFPIFFSADVMSSINQSITQPIDYTYLSLLPRWSSLTYDARLAHANPEAPQCRRRGRRTANSGLVFVVSRYSVRVGRLVHP